MTKSPTGAMNDYASRTQKSIRKGRRNIKPTNYYDQMAADMT